MSSKHAIVGSINYSLDSLINASNAVPADKLNWKPAETARSIQAILVECIMTPVFGKAVLEQAGKGITDIAMPDMEKYHARQVELGETLTDIPAIEAALRESHSSLNDAILAASDETISRDIVMPFGGGMKMTVENALQWMSAHLQYHYGQVNYIQTLYGDTAEH